MDAEKLSKDFQENIGVFRYPQTVVCDTVSAALTDLNEWRRREILPKDGYEKRGRIMYTGEMLLRAGFLAELAPFIGPTDASRFADDFLMSHPFNPNAFIDKVAVFRPRRGEYFGTMLVDQHETLVCFGHAKIVFPIGRLILQWMIGAELRMQDITD